MRIEQIRVDGFGVLADLEINDLPGGLTVVQGENEAGKSTLLDFLRGVLFGFPDRRHRLAYHSPLRGGRHGGAIRVADESGARWMLERHVDTREPLLTSLDGAPASVAVLARLLGNADGDLFRNVFAFGLGELSALDLLDHDGIRDAVFSAGVLGAGRSAGHAVRLLEQQRALLVRQRRGDATANALRSRIDQVEIELRRARRDAESYPSLLAEHRRLRGHLDEARGATESLRGRLGEIDRLVALWPTFRDRATASRELSESGDPEEKELVALERESQLRWLRESRTGHLERVAKQVERRTTIEGAEIELDEIRLRLGGTEPVPISLEVRDRVDRLVIRVPDAMVEVKAAAEDARRVEAALDDATTALEERSDTEFRATTATEAAIASARHLLLLRSRLERLQDRARAAANEAELNRLRAERERGGADRTIVTLLLLTGLVSAVLGVAGFALAARHGMTLDLLGALGLLGALCALTASLRLRSNLAIQPEQHVESVENELAEVSGEVATTAAALGLRSEQINEVDDLLASLQGELLRRQERDALERTKARAVVEARRATARRSEAEASLRAIDEEAAAISASLGFAKPLSLDGLKTALGQLGQAEELRQRIDRVQRAIDRDAGSVEEFELLLHGLEKELGVPGSDDVTRSVRELEALLDTALSHANERGALRATVDGSDRRLDEALGFGETGRRLRAELASGDLAGWDGERRSLTTRLTEAEAAVEDCLARARDAERDFEAVRASSDVASLELEQASLTEELDAVLDRWLVYGAAKSLLEACLARYERERQPKVIAYASELFEEITDGRYVQLVAHEDDDGKHRRIAALSASGARVDSGDLSRGTAEQLYLCLRLAFATTFAEQSAALPIVVDDVLVNFDPVRAAAVARVFARVAQDHQVLAFTCHPHVVELFRAAEPQARVVQLRRAS